MVDIATFRQIVSSFPNTEELPHFENTSFRIKKKIFATLKEKSQEACVKLSEIDQSVFCTFDKTVIYPVNNKWGKQGWTLVNLSKVELGTLTDLLNTAYNEVLSKTSKSKKA